MRYFNLVFLLLLLSWSWSSFRSSEGISQSIHVGIQEDFQRIVTEYISEKLPDAKNLRFEKLWSEPQGEAEVKASFQYSFSTPSEGNTKVIISGFAIIRRDPKSTEEEETWNLEELHIFDEHIIFEDGLNVNVSQSKSTTKDSRVPNVKINNESQQAE